jgi:hypothetical protein
MNIFSTDGSPTLKMKAAGSWCACTYLPNIMVSHQQHGINVTGNSA